MASAGFTPWRSAPYRRLVAAATISVLGNAVAPIGLAFAVLDLTGSVSDLGLVVGARSVMNVLFLLAGGVLADRSPPKVVLIGCNTAGATTQAAVAAVVLTRVDSIGLLAALSAVNGAVSAFSQPASAALLPATVDRVLLRHATALARIGASTALVLGAAAAGVLVAVVGPGWCIAADAASFAVAAAVLTGLHLPPTTPAATTPLPTTPLPTTPPLAAASPVTGAAGSMPPAALLPMPTGPVRREVGRVRAELGQGWGQFRSRTWLWVVTGSAMAGNAAYVGAMQVLGPQVADHSIGRRLWGTVLAFLTLGMVAGGFLAIRVRPRYPLRYGLTCVAAVAAGPLALGLRPVFAALAGAAFATGVGLEQFGVSWETSMAHHIPPELLARATSIDLLGSFIAIPLGQIAVGPLAHTFGPRTTLLGAAAVILIAAAAPLTNRSVRDLRNDPPPRHRAPRQRRTQPPRSSTTEQPSAPTPGPGSARIGTFTRATP